MDEERAVRSPRSMRDSVMVKRMARHLKISKVEAIGYIHLLLWWALDHAMAGGSFEGLDAEDIAEAVDWMGDADQFLNVLEEAGLVVAKEDWIGIKNWDDYQECWCESR